MSQDIGPRERSAWPTVRLSEVVAVNPGRPALQRSDDAPTAFIPMSAISESLGLVQSYAMRPFGEVAKGYTYFEEGDLLFAKITPCMQNGKHAIVRNIPGGFGFGSTEFHVIRVSDRVDSGYLWYFLRQPIILSDAATHFRGAVGQQRVPPSYLENLTIPLPAVSVQRRIVAKLDEQMAALDHAEKALAEQQAAALAFKRATLQTALDLAAHSDWPAVTIGQLYQSIPIGGTPSRGIAAYFDGSFPWVSIADMNNTNLITDTREHLSESGVKNSNVKLVRAGSLLFSFKLTVGKVAFAGVDLYTNEAIAAFEPIPRVNLQYLRYALPFAADLTTDSNTFGARMLNKQKISSLSIPLPGSAEQRRVADTLDNVSLYADRVFERVAGRLGLLQRLRSRLLDAAFSGEI